MADNNTDKFNSIPVPGSGSSSNQGRGLPATTIFRDGDGKVIKTVPLDSTRRSVLTTTYSASDVGIKTIKAEFTGDADYAARGSDNFTMHVSDANGNNSTAQTLGTVNQIVAGAGIYISAPNGQGTVTIATHPIPVTHTTDDIYDITWSQLEGPLPVGTVGQFVAVGANGLNMRSRDGESWISMPGSTATIYGVNCEINANIPNFHTEYTGVGPGGKAIYGRSGSDSGDGMTEVFQLSDQDGVIDAPLIGTVAFYNGAYEQPITPPPYNLYNYAYDNTFTTPVTIFRVNQQGTAPVLFGYIPASAKSQIGTYGAVIAVTPTAVNTTFTTSFYGQVDKPSGGVIVNLSTITWGLGNYTATVQVYNLTSTGGIGSLIYTGPNLQFTWTR